MWQRVNDGTGSWYSEEQGVVEFLQSMLDWTFDIEPDIEPEVEPTAAP